MSEIPQQKQSGVQEERTRLRGVQVRAPWAKLAQHISSRRNPAYWLEENSQGGTFSNSQLKQWRQVCDHKDTVSVGTYTVQEVIDFTFFVSISVDISESG